MIFNRTFVGSLGGTAIPLPIVGVAGLTTD